MKVVILRSNPVDPDSRVEKAANSLNKAGYDVEILGWDRNDKYDEKESIIKTQSGSIKVHRFGIPSVYGGGVKQNLLPLLKFQLKLYNWLKNNIQSIDVIHACDFDTAFVASKLASKHKKKLVYDIFDFYVDSFNVPKCLRRVVIDADKKIINSAEATIICTENRKNQLLGANPQKLFVIHNTPDISNDQLWKIDLNQDKIKIVYVGILSEGRFLREITDYVIQDDRFEFHIGGFGKYQKYFEDISKAYSNIIYYGKLPYLNTLDLENSCDLMVAIYDPSIANHYYAAPNKFYESLALGKPIIMAKDTGLSDLIVKYNIGEVIEYNRDAFGEGLEKLVKRKNEWSDIEVRMKTLYEENYSWKTMEKKLLRLYKDLF